MTFSERESLRRVGIFCKNRPLNRQNWRRVGIVKIPETLCLTGFSEIGMLTKCQQKKIVATRSQFDINGFGDGFASPKAAAHDTCDQHAIVLDAGCRRATSNHL